MNFTESQLQTAREVIWHLVDQAIDADNPREQDQLNHVSTLIDILEENQSL